MRAALLSLLVLCLISLPLSAHAILQRASPAKNSVQSGPDVPVELKFNSRIDAGRSRISCATPDDKIIPINIQTSGTTDVISSTLKGLKPGSYRLRWQVLSIDGHITRGEIPFKVK